MRSRGMQTRGKSEVLEGHWLIITGQSVKQTHGPIQNLYSDALLGSRNLAMQRWSTASGGGFLCSRGSRKSNSFALQHSHNMKKPRRNQADVRSDELTSELDSRA